MTTSYDDAQIQQDVLNELRWDPNVGGTDIGIAVRNGTVTLTGSVTNDAKRMAAQEAAHRVTGVLDVANDIQVNPPGSHVRTDTQIAQAVRRALEWDPALDDHRIRSTVSNGWVTLSGVVERSHDRDEAERAVRRLSGVHGVINQIGLSPSDGASEVARKTVRYA